MIIAFKGVEVTVVSKREHSLVYHEASVYLHIQAKEGNKTITIGYNCVFITMDAYNGYISLHNPVIVPYCATEIDNTMKMAVITCIPTIAFQPTIFFYIIHYTGRNFTFLV